MSYLNKSFAKKISSMKFSAKAVPPSKKFHAKSFYLIGEFSPIKNFITGVKLFKTNCMFLKFFGNNMEE